MLSEGETYNFVILVLLYTIANIMLVRRIILIPTRNNTKSSIGLVIGLLKHWSST